MSDTINLTARERAILDSYAHMIEGLAAYLGSGYEIALHSLESFEHSVIKIINGYHTGRSEGAPITDLALSMLSQLEQQTGTPHAIVYHTRNRRGDPLRSTTIPILSGGDRIIGLLCINFYLNTPLCDVLNIVWPDEQKNEALLQQETFAEDAEDLITAQLHEIATVVRLDPEISATLKNKEIVRRLNARGVFGLKGSVDLVAAQLGISRNTVYLHLRNINN